MYKEGKISRKQLRYLDRGVKYLRSLAAQVRRLEKVSEGLSYVSIGVDMLSLFGYAWEGESLSSEEQCRAMETGIGLLSKVPLVKRVPGLGASLRLYEETFKALGEFIEELEVGGAGDRNVERIRGGMMPTNTGPFGKEYSKTWRRLHGM